jgi:hypothetical protein
VICPARTQRRLPAGCPCDWDRPVDRVPLRATLCGPCPRRGRSNPSGGRRPPRPAPAMIRAYNVARASCAAARPGPPLRRRKTGATRRPITPSSAPCRSGLHAATPPALCPSAHAPLRPPGRAQRPAHGCLSSYHAPRDSPDCRRPAGPLTTPPAAAGASNGYPSPTSRRPGRFRQQPAVPPAGVGEDLQHSTARKSSPASCAAAIPASSSPAPNPRPRFGSVPTSWADHGHSPAELLFVGVLPGSSRCLEMSCASLLGPDVRMLSIWREKGQL